MLTLQSTNWLYTSSQELHRLGNLGLQQCLICKCPVSLSETVEKRVKVRAKEFQPLEITKPQTFILEVH
jgi:hypothetical protein